MKRSDLFCILFNIWLAAFVIKDDLPAWMCGLVAAFYLVGTCKISNDELEQDKKEKP